MSYPGVQEQDVPTPAQPFPEQPTVVQQTVQPARPSYGGNSWSPPRQFDFRTPSGALCRLQKIDPEEAMTMGLLNHLDIFSPKLLRDAEGKPRDPREVEEIVVKKLAEGDKGDDFFLTVKRICLAAVVEPKMVDEPKDAELPPGTYSINNVNFRDKMAIFHAVFGEDMKKIEPFRGGQEGGMGAVQREQDVQHTTERDPWDT